MKNKKFCFLIYLFLIQNNFLSQKQGPVNYEHNYENLNEWLQLNYDLNRIDQYSKSQINNPKKLFYDLFSSKCTETKLIMYKKRIAFFNELFNNTEKKRLIKKLQNKGIIDPFHNLHFIFKNELLPLTLLDTSFGFFGLPSISDRNPNELINKKYTQILLQNAPRMLINSFSWKIIHFTIKSYFELFTKKNSALNISMNQLVDRIISFSNMQDYQPSNIIKLKMSNAEREYFKQNIKNIYSLSLILRYPTILLYELGLIDGNNLKKYIKEYSAKNQIKTTDLVQNSVSLYPLNLFMPKEDFMINKICLTLITPLVFSPYYFGAFIRTQMNEAINIKKETDSLKYQSNYFHEYIYA